MGTVSSQGQMGYVFIKICAFFVYKMCLFMQYVSLARCSWRCPVYKLYICLYNMCIFV